MDTPSGPNGRRLRWHQTFQKFQLDVKYIPGPENVVPDAMSRWAYPASEGYRDVSRHGTERDALEVKEFHKRETEEDSAAIFQVHEKSANAMSLQQSALTVRPVGAEAGSPGPPPSRFTFADPHSVPLRRGRARKRGQLARQGKESPRNPPTRSEVGPADFEPDGTNSEDENPDEGTPGTPLGNIAENADGSKNDGGDDQGQIPPSIRREEMLDYAPPVSYQNPDCSLWYKSCPAWGGYGKF